MPPILFPSSTAPGHDLIEGSGRLINCYAERLQVGSPAKAGYVIRRAPGLTLFSATSETGFRGMFYNGLRYLHAAFSGTLLWIGPDGVEATNGVLPGGPRLTFLTSATDATDLTTYTYAAVGLGAAHWNRRIVVAVGFDDAGDYPAAAVTIGGVAATLVAGQGSSIALYIALVPTGTTGNIVVQYATAATRSAIGVWRLDGTFSNTAYLTEGYSGTGAIGSTSFDVRGGHVTLAAAYSASTGAMTWSSDVTEDFDAAVESTRQISGASTTGNLVASKTITVTGTGNNNVVMASWEASGSDFVTFAQNNAASTNDVVCSPISGAYSFFGASALTVVNVNGELPNSVCFGEGYFFFTIPTGLIYASNLNSTTVTSTDVIRFESKSEALVRGVFFNGELFIFGKTCCEVWASNGNPNATGFPFNRVTVFWRGLVGLLAITGHEDGFHASLVWVADDASVRMLVGYDPVQISTPDLERAIAAVPDKSLIRAFCYDVDGHASIVIDLAQTATWVYDLNEKTWEERKSDTIDYWRATGNTAKAFDKWLVGDYLTGNLYQIDPASKVDGAENTISFIAESIEMEAFPQRLGISRADFNFVTGVGDATTRDPDVFVSWSDDGGHTWSDPVTKKLGEAGRYFDEIRLNRVGLTGRKGRRWRVRVDDPVYVGLLGGDMVVSGRP